MAEPTLALTFSDLLLRVAEFLGVAYYGSAGTSAAAVPTDAHDLDLCKRIVNDGWRRFVNSYPKWNWLLPTVGITLATPVLESTATSGGATTLVDSTLAAVYADDYFNGKTLRITGGTGISQFKTISDYTGATGTFTVSAWTTNPDATSTYHVIAAQCVEGEAWRYYLPDGFYGHLVRFWTYPVNGPRIAIEPTTEADIRALRASGDSEGPPYLAAHRPLEGTVGAFSDHWEVLFYPTPSAEYVVTARARLYPNKLVDLTDRPNCGIQFDEAVLASCLAEAELSRDDKMGVQAQKFADAVTRAVYIDQQSGPRNLGYNRDRSDRAMNDMRHFNFSGVDTYNGVSV